jgi:uncharacterized membrane protein
MIMGCYYTPHNQKLLIKIMTTYIIIAIVFGAYTYTKHKGLEKKSRITTTLFHGLAWPYFVGVALCKRFG